MKVLFPPQIPFAFAVLSILLMPSLGLAVDPAYDSAGTGTVGSSLSKGSTNQPVTGETHPYSLTQLENAADGTPIYTYPNQSQAGPTMGTDGTQTPSGLPVTTTRLITPLNQFGNTSIPSGSYNFGFSGGGAKTYEGPYRGSHARASGSSLPQTSTSSVDLEVGGY